MARIRGIQQIYQSQNLSEQLLRVSGGITTLSFLSSGINFEKDGTGTLIQIVDPNKLLFTLVGGTSYFLGTDSADGSDNRLLCITSSSTNDAARGSFIVLKGNEYPGGATLSLESGDISGSNLLLRVNSADGNIIFNTNATDRWKLTETGHLIPQVDAGYDIGSPSLRIRKIYVESSDSINIVENEIPTGAINGINTVYTVTNDFIASSFKLYLNGLRQTPGVGNDFEVTNSNEITMTTAPQAGDMLICDYRIA